MAFLAEWVYKEQHPDYLKKAMGESPLVYSKNGGVTSPGRSLDASANESPGYSKHTTHHNMSEHDIKPTMFESQIQDEQPYHKPEIPSDEDDEFENAESVADLDTFLQKKKTAGKAPMANRASVSAEVFGKNNKKENFKPRSIPKTAFARQQIKDRIVQSFMFKGLEERELEICIDAMDIKAYSKGAAIIKQGEEGNELFIVESGTLDCTKVAKGSSSPQFLLTYRPGMAFGE
jgi:hypothetical protein